MQVLSIHENIRNPVMSETCPVCNYMRDELACCKCGIYTNPKSELAAPTLWSERVYVQDVKQEAGEIWLRISAANAPRGTPPVACFATGQILVIEIKHDPLGVHSPNNDSATSV